MSQDDKTAGELPELEAFIYSGVKGKFAIVVSNSGIQASLTESQAAQIIHWAKVGPKMLEALSKWSEYMALVKNAATVTLERKEAHARHRKIDELEGEAWKLTAALKAAEVKL